MDDVNKKKPMEFWLRLRFASRHQNGFIVTLLMIHLISIAWCDVANTKRNDSRQSSLGIAFNRQQQQWNADQYKTVAKAASTPVTRKRIDSQPLDNHFNANDQKTAIALNLELKSQNKVYAMHNNAIYESDSHHEHHWNNITQQPYPIVDRRDQMPKKPFHNLLTKQVNTINAIDTRKANASQRPYVHREEKIYRYKVMRGKKGEKSKQWNCELCRIVPGPPIRSRNNNYPLYRGMFVDGLIIACFLGLF